MTATLTKNEIQFVDPDQDTLFGWDDSANNIVPIILGTNLSITGTTLNAIGAISSVSNSDGTLTISPTTGAVIASRAAITGDISIAGGSNTSVLATVNSNVGSFNYGSFTVNAKGLIIAASSGAAPEVPLTFSTGLTRTTNTITANLSTGVSGGQSVIGGTAASNNLTLSSTSNGTKGKILFGTSAYDEVNNLLGIGTASPSAPITVQETAFGAILILGTSGIFSGNADFGIKNFAATSWWNVTAALLPTGNVGLGFYDAVNNLFPLQIETGAPNNTLFANSSGNVGIGTASPGSNKLNVNGSVTIATNLGVGTASPDTTAHIRNTVNGADTAQLTLEGLYGSGAYAGIRFRFNTFHVTGWGADIQAIDAGTYVADMIFRLENGGNDATKPTEKVRITGAGNLGVGTGATVSARMHAISTTEQLRLGYDSSNYFSTTVGSTGAVTFDAVGSGAGFIFSDDVTHSGRSIFVSGENHKVRVVTAAGAVTVATSDYIVVVNKGTGAATTANLPASPATGDTYVIKDGKGDAATNNITVTPAAGNIDGAGTYVMSINYQSVTVVYNGTQWNLV